MIAWSKELFIGAEFGFSGKQNFCNKNHEQADSGSGSNFTNKIEEVSKLKPFNQNQVEMVYKSENTYIYAIGGPAHARMTGFHIALFSSFLRNEQVEQEGSDIGNQYTGCCMQAGCSGKIIKG